MPRRRMIDPQIWRNEKIGSLPDAGRLLFIGIFSQADDDGRLKASPRFLMANIFPYDKDKTEEDIKRLRDQCTKLGFIRLYTNGKEEYLDIPGWHEHQEIRKDRYTPSKLPSIDDAVETSPLNQPITFGYRPPTRDHAQEEHAAQHTLAQQLQANEWQPTGEKIIQVETNKRLGNLYADIVAITETQKYILIEVKMYPLQPKDLGQVLGYRREMETRQLTPITTFLIGGELGKLTREEASLSSVKLLNLRDLLVATTGVSVKSTGETTDIPNIIKSSIVKFNTPLLRKGAHTKKVDPVVNKIFTEMRTVLGYPEKCVAGSLYPIEKNKKEGSLTPAKNKAIDPIPNYGKEGVAIKRMLTRGFTPEEILACWRSKVSQRSGEFVSMTWVNEDIGKKGGEQPGTHRKGDKEPSANRYRQSLE